MSDRHRNPDFERDFLHAAAREVGLSGIGFDQDVGDRLTKGQEIYGNQALEMSLAELQRELGEEGFDLGAWGVLAAQSREVDSLNDDKRIHALLLLQRIAGKGAEVRYLLRQLAEVLAP